MYPRISRYIFLIVSVLSQLNTYELRAQVATSHSTSAHHLLVLVISNDDSLIRESMEYINKNWEERYEAMMIEVLYFSLNRDLAQDYVGLLQEKTDKNFGFDMHQWYQWLWSKTATYGPEYFDFKATLYRYIDPRFEKYFSQRQGETTIRIDEVIWGGVKQDGIPPLRNPKMVNAESASYLEEDNIVFGIKINGDVRAYPKRILAWHELFTDIIGGRKVAGVYCTLCGTVILYESEHQGVSHQLGTSGFLYRSNKLMYDATTQSLWSTLEGDPVIGSLVEKGIRLDYRSVVTTTWGEWKSRHPNTKVLSMDTGFIRDYREGVAYNNYFATDELMFQVPEIDNRLKNKDEVLALRLPKITNKSLAISSEFLKKNTVYSDDFAGVQFTVFTDRSGAHRVYDTNGILFGAYDQVQTAITQQGEQWTVYENKLVSDSGQVLKRIPSYNAFWFGFHAAFPNARLIY